jgi:2-polyprenyl-3-methyl-5-hydroxy-6-metoxy-1,4-benzoquinol methylase
MSGHEAACPICAGASTENLAVLRGNALLRCRACGHRFLHVNASTVEVIYNDHYAGFRDDPVFEREATRLVATELVPRVPPPAELLDVGCGNGAFLAVARAAGYAVLGVDVSEAAGELCRKRGMEARIGDVRSEQVIGNHEKFGLITFWDVIEHLPDPASFLRRAYDALVPGGCVVIKTPRTSNASVSLSARVPRLAGAILQAPSHIQYYRETDLRALLERVGFASPELVHLGGMRSAASGGPIRRRLARRVLRTFHRAAGDGNLLAIAKRA